MCIIKTDGSIALQHYAANEGCGAPERSARAELQGPETKNTRLINEAIETPFQSPKSREMVF